MQRGASVGPPCRGEPLFYADSAEAKGAGAHPAPRSRPAGGTWILSALALHAVALACWAADGPSKPHVVIDSGLQQPLIKSRALIDNGRFGEAIRLLQSILNESENTVVLLDGRYIDARLEANRLIGSLPLSAQAVYEQDYGTFARQELQRAELAGGIDSLLAVATVYRNTDAGRQALADVAGLYFDSGRFIEAAAAARQRLNLSGAPREESAAAARLITAWLRLGEISRARRWMDERRSGLAQLNIEVQGTKYRLDRWLDERIAASSSKASAHTTVGGHPQSAPAENRDRIALVPVWHKRPGGSAVMASLIDQAIARRAASGIAPVFDGVPLIVGKSLVVRRADELAAFDLPSGETRWSRDVSPSGGSLENAGVDAVVDRACSGSATTAISADDQHVFTVVEDVTPDSESFFTRRGRGMRIQSPPKNSLEAYDLRDGRRVWRLESLPEGVPSSGEESTRDLDFLGPPLVLPGVLYVLARTDEGACLLALNPADGRIRWSHSLTGFAGFEPDTVSWAGPPCVPIEAEGLLLCPTPEGMLIAVDLVTRKCRWAYRAQPTDEPPKFPPRWGRGMGASEPRWLHAWRESVIRIDGGVCLTVTPRSSAIHALAIESGQILWTRDVPAGLFLGPVIEGRLLALAPFRAYCFRVADGTSLWEAPIGLPSGRGVVIDRQYFLPQADGGLTSIDIANGRVAFPAGHSPALGNLVPAGPDTAAVASLTCDQLALFPSLTQARAETADALRKEPGNRQVMHRLARVELEVGNFDRAENLLATLSDPLPAVISKARPAAKTADGDLTLVEDEGLEFPPEDAQHELFETLLADLAHNSCRCDKIGPTLEHAAQGEEELAMALRAIAVAEMANGRGMPGVKTLYRLARLELPSQISVDHAPPRLVDFERQIRADLEDVLQGASQAERREADGELRQLVQTALDQGDAVVLGRIWRRLVGAEWKRDFRERVEAALRPDPSFLQAQLELWDGTTSSERPRAADSWCRLAELYRARGDRMSAATCYLQLARDYADVSLDDGRKASEVLARLRDDRPLTKELRNAQLDPWPPGPPEVTTDTQAGSTGRFLPLPLEILPGSLCEGIDVAIDRDGKTLRFQGGPQLAYWELSLPDENSALRRLFLLHRGWSVGPILIVQIGTDLLGVAPLDETGEAKVLWHVDLLGENPPHVGDLALRFFPRRPIPVANRVSVTDRLGRPVACVGPVRPGYICFYDRGRLTALDPLSGRPFWQRNDVAAPDLWTGDESRVILLDRRSKRIRIFRALDGKTLAERDADAVGDPRWLEDCDAVTQTPQNDKSQVSRIDLVGGRRKWTRSLPGGTQIVRLDIRRYAATEPDGTLHVLDSTTGTDVASHRIAGGEHCLQVHATSDQRLFYLAFSVPFGDQENSRANGQRDDWRNPLVNGVLCALDRSSGRLLWSRRFEDGVFAVDQSRVAPFLVFSYRHVGPGDEGIGAAWPILHCIDKRTGKDVYFDRLPSAQSPSKTYAETDVGRLEIFLRLPDAEIRFRYHR